jgi:hypothetical protein
MALSAHQPRRIAARATAARIAQELKTERRRGRLQDRFNDKVSPHSYKLMTDGILLAKPGDRDLRQYDAIIIDGAPSAASTSIFYSAISNCCCPRRPDLTSEYLGHHGRRALRAFQQCAGNRCPEGVPGRCATGRPRRRECPVLLRLDRAGTMRSAWVGTMRPARVTTVRPARVATMRPARAGTMRRIWPMPLSMQ